MKGSFNAPFFYAKHTHIDAEKAMYKQEFNYLSILVIHLQNGRYEIRHIRHDELE